MKSNKKNRTSIIVSGIVLVAVIFFGAYYMRASGETADTDVPALQTAKVRTGDLVITANGAGSIVPSAQVDLAFRSSGVVYELNVTVGDSVNAMQVLARLEDNIQAEADFQALFTDEGVAQAGLAFVDAQIALDEATNDLKYLIGSDAYYWEVQLEQAEDALAALDNNATDKQQNNAQEVVDTARARKDYFLSLRSNIPEADLALAHANLESAKVALLDAQTARDIVQAGTEALDAPMVALGIETTKLEQARLALESSRLVAPFDGSIIALNAVQGQTVNTSTFLTLATTHDLLVRFYLDETDIEKAATGKRVSLTFDAYPDNIVEGKIILVEPSLQTIDGMPVVVAWANLLQETDVNIFSGMTVDVEVIATETHDALIVPVQALRELTPGSYAVFVVQSDGQLLMRPVTVGLRDFANAEILSGVDVGDIISTGTVETQ